ncbi:MAG: tRNA 2-thiocytidine biosynthesis protein TtcA [Bacilli bacterium]|nr:tRNA 2-thiocytidine biosynthesis protein TtcA [Bacilli bacterium]
MAYIRNVLSSLRKADLDFALIDEGDRIAVGVSGGKDSLCLLKALSIYTLYSKKKFTVHPIFLDLGFDFDRNEIKKLEKFAEECGTKLSVVDSKFVYEILQAHKKPDGHLPCSICSRMKKAAINAEAKRLHCNKVAFAHHNEDSVETLFMNMLHGGRVATFDPKMPLERAGVTFIRPLIYCHEWYLSRMAKEENLPIVDTNCPANKHTEREVTKDFVKKLYKEYPESVMNFRNLLSNYESHNLYFPNIEYVHEKNPSLSLRPIILPEDMRGTKIATKKKKEGEVDYLALWDHKRVGEISYLHLSAHKVLLFNVSGEKKKLKLAIPFLMEKIAERVNPVHFYMYGNKDLALSMGFKEVALEGRKSPAYMITIKK